MPMGIKNISRSRYSLLILFFSLLTSFVVAEEKFPYLGQITSDGVNIRAGQSANFEKVGQLKASEPVVVLEKSYSWYKIRLPVTAKSYISAKYVKELDKKTGEVTTDRVNVRCGPGEQSSILGQADKGQYIRILEKLEGWYKIEPIEESYGWIKEGFLKYQSHALPPQRDVAAPTRNIYAQKRAAETTPAPSEAPSAAVSEAPNPEQKTVFTSGVVEPLWERSLAQDVRHMVTGDNNASYYLKGPQEIDVFRHRKVAVEGTVQFEITAPHPIILVKKINLIL